MNHVHHEENKVVDYHYPLTTKQGGDVTAGLGLKLKELRESRRLSRRRVAEAVGISPTRYGDYEAGFTHHRPEHPAVPSRQLVIKLAKFFDFPEGVLLSLAGYPVEEPTPPPKPSQLDVEAAEVAQTYCNLPERERELLLAVVRAFRATARRSDPSEP